MLSINKKNIDTIFKSRITNNITLYDSKKKIYNNDNLYVKNLEDFELNDNNMIYNRKPMITYVNRINFKNKDDEYKFYKYSFDLKKKQNENYRKKLKNEEKYINNKYIEDTKNTKNCNCYMEFIS